MNIKLAAANSRYKRFGHLAEFKDGFVLGKFTSSVAISNDISLCKIHNTTFVIPTKEESH